MAQNDDKPTYLKPTKLSGQELKKILQEHRDWHESRHEEGNQADLRDLDLGGYNFQGACLNEAKLQGAFLKEANLDGAELNKAMLQGAKLKGASLQKASLSGANLQSAHLEGAKLQKARLDYSDLQEAFFDSADLEEASLLSADLRRAILPGVNLQKAILLNANFREAILAGARIQGADLRGVNLEGANVTGIKYNRKHRYRGIRVATCYGSPRFKRFAQDQDFIEETRSRWFLFPIYLLWSISSDCGRSFIRWAGWSVLLAVFFGLVFYWLGPEAFHRAKLPWEWSTMIYYSVVTFTTLGFGDVVPKTTEAAWWVMGEVIAGYVMLGGLISIFASKLARRS
jgi:uncharacterized protein YjbI with pentapeptide repeats